MPTSTETAAALAALRSAVDAVAALLVADPPPPPPNPVLGLEATEVAADAIAVKWTASSVLDWAVGRDGADVFGSGAWSTTLAPSTDRFRFTSLLPATTYTITLRAGDGRSATVTATTAGVAPPPPPPPSTGGDHGPRALTDGWVAHELARDDFQGTVVDPAKWSLYDSVGHGGKGLRRPSQFTIVDDATALGGRALRVAGTPEGTTGGMAHKVSQRYGRWAARMRVPGGDARYHPVLLTWPSAENWPVGGEIDFSEGACGVNKVQFFLHYSAQNKQTSGSTAVDVTQWHWWECEWAPDGVRGWCDGKLFFEDKDPSHSPPGPMHLCIQLDWFPGSAKLTGAGEMLVDACRVYKHPATPA